MRLSFFEMLKWRASGTLCDGENALVWVSSASSKRVGSDERLSPCALR